MLEGTYCYLAQERVVYGRRSYKAVVDEVNRRGAKRVFVVSGKTLNRATPVVAAVTKRFEATLD
jgi:alcohol dehydrogenase class IV